MQDLPHQDSSAACLQTLSPDKAEMHKCTAGQVRQLLGITRGGQEALIALALLTGRPAVHSLPRVLHRRLSPVGCNAQRLLVVCTGTALK